MKWNNRLKEQASERNRNYVWWVHQAEAEKRIKQLEKRIEELQKK